MKKDVIYIDIEDDITSIIGKVKAASASIVALVPPKRAGVLQSAVNLKLLQKAAADGDKRVVLITSDHLLTTLAAGIKIPVAKNLQSKPEIASIAALEIDDEDIINGDDLPVGELAKTVPKTDAELEDLEAEKALAALQSDEPSKSNAKKKPMKTARGMKVPNFDRFRKWLFLGGGVGIFLILFLVWAIGYAPRATVTITASTTKTSIEIPLTLTPGGESKIGENVFKPITQEIKKTQSVEFDATGDKEVGDKAKGRIVFSNCETPSAQTIPAGTELEVDGNTYTTTAAATVGGGKGDFVSGCTEPGESGQVGIVAANIGEDYNTSSGTDFSVNSHGDELSAKAVTAISGGTKKQVKVVTADDVAKAQEKLKAQDSDSAKQELHNKFTKNDIIVEESFAANAGKPTADPAIDHEATKAQLTIETTYRLYGLKRSEVKTLLDTFLKDQIDGRDDQRIYDNGENTLAFSDFNGTSVALSTTGYIGPKIEEKQLAKEIEGKRYGEIQQKVEAIRGVEDVHTDFWPFWVTSAPSPDKITIKFVVSNKNNEQ
jgi:phosphopantetheine adenylyltransferase